MEIVQFHGADRGGIEVDAHAVDVDCSGRAWVPYNGERCRRGGDGAQKATAPRTATRR